MCAVCLRLLVACLRVCSLGSALGSADCVHTVYFWVCVYVCVCVAARAPWRLTPAQCILKWVRTGVRWSKCGIRTRVKEVARSVVTPGLEFFSLPFHPPSSSPFPPAGTARPLLSLEFPLAEAM